MKNLKTVMTGIIVMFITFGITEASAQELSQEEVQVQKLLNELKTEHGEEVARVVETSIIIGDLSENPKESLVFYEFAERLDPGNRRIKNKIKLIKKMLKK